MDREEYLARIDALVDQHGVMVQQVAPDEGAGGWSFGYTVGLFEVDHPEFIVFDLPSRLCAEILNDLAASVLRAGMRYSSGDRVHHLLKSPVWLAEVDVPGDYLFMAVDSRERRAPNAVGELAALQVVIPDEQSRVPWLIDRPGPPPPLLGAAPDPSVGVDQTLPDAPTRRLQGW